MEDKKWCVYMHTSSSGKVYIGITSCKPIERWGSDGRGYLGKNKNGEFRQPAIANAINKYSNWDEWQHDIIAIDLSSAEAKQMEQELIIQYQSDDGNYGYNISPGGEGAKLSEETRRKISESNRGKNNPFSKRVICIETNTIYDSAGEAERITEIKHQTILACCNHKPHRKTAGGFHWEFYDTYIEQRSDILCAF